LLVEAGQLYKSGAIYGMVLKGENSVTTLVRYMLGPRDLEVQLWFLTV
jgi:hypothetical protein